MFKTDFSFVHHLCVIQKGENGARKFLQIMGFIVNFLSTQYPQKQAVKVNLFYGNKKS